VTGFVGIIRFRTAHAKKDDNESRKRRTDASAGQVSASRWCRNRLSCVESLAVRRILGWAAPAVISVAALVSLPLLAQHVVWNATQWGSAAESVAGVATAGTLVSALVLFSPRGEKPRAGAGRSCGRVGRSAVRHMPLNEPRVEQAEIQVYVRNASELPVVVKQLAYSIHTKWLVPEGKQNWELVAGRLPVPRFFVDYIQVPPQRTWDNNASPYEANLAHTAKAPCSSLSQTVSAARSTGF
jgi:hypothetical protein